MRAARIAVHAGGMQVNVTDAVATRMSCRAFLPHAGARGHGARDPRRGAAGAVGRQPAAVAGATRSPASRSRNCSRGARQAARRTRAARLGVRHLPAGTLGAVPLAPLQVRRGHVRDDRRAARGQARRACCSSRATTSSSARRSGCSSASTAAWGRRSGRTSACTCRRVMLLAREHGLHTCAQEAWSRLAPDRRRVPRSCRRS